MSGREERRLKKEQKLQERLLYLAPYPRMSPKIALTTLGRVEAMDGVDEPRIVAFIEKYR